MKLYRQVSTTERLPDYVSMFITDKGWMKFDLRTKSFYDDDLFSQNVKWFMEEVELPTAEEIAQEAEIDIDNYEDKALFFRGANYILNLIKNK